MNEPLQFVQQSFRGGMDQSVDPTRIPANCYPLLINGRSRYDLIETVRAPRQLTTLPLGTYQGVYAAANFAVLFISGQAYYRDYSIAGSQFSRIDPFLMSPTAYTIWAELVPASTLNYKRVPVNTDITSPVSLTSLVSATPQALIAQDGISQPWIITPDAKARVTQTYAQWTVDNREYVPVGRQMLYSGGILYTVAANQVDIYRSVSGRPLDFMVNVTTPDGDKSSSDEAVGGAPSTSHRVGYNPITCLAQLNTPDGGFFVSTARDATKVVPDFNSLIFGEPQFDNAFLFPSGVLNQFSFTDILGDSVFIDFTGVRSFNAVSQFRWEGKNSPFSAKVSNLFRNVTQDRPCVGTFDNYTLFAVNTIYGTGVLVYDEIAQAWVGLDLYPGVGAIKQFAEIKTDTFRQLVFITHDNKYYEAFLGTTAPLKLYAGEWTSQDPKVTQIGQTVKVVLSDVKEDGTFSITPYTDRFKETTIPMPVLATLPTNPLPLAIPFGVATRDTVRVKTADIGRVQHSWKIGLLLEMDFEATISHIALTAEKETQDADPEEEAEAFSRFNLDYIVPRPALAPIVNPTPLVPPTPARQVFADEDNAEFLDPESGGHFIDPES